MNLPEFLSLLIAGCLLAGIFIKARNRAINVGILCGILAWIVSLYTSSRADIFFSFMTSWFFITFIGSWVFTMLVHYLVTKWNLRNVTGSKT